MGDNQLYAIWAGVVLGIVTVISISIAWGTISVNQSNDKRKMEIVKTCTTAGQNPAICASLYNK